MLGQQILQADNRASIAAR